MIQKQNFILSHLWMLFFVLFLFFVACGKKEQASEEIEASEAVTENKQSSSPVEKKRKDYIHVQAKTIKPSKISQKIRVGARLMSTDSVDIPSQTAGVVTGIQAQEGQRVKKGAVLLYVDASRSGVSYRPGPVRAPIDGVVARLPVKSGNKVSQGTTVARVVGTSAYKVTAAVPVLYAHMLRVGTRGTLSLLSFPQKDLALVVRAVSPKINATTGSVDITLKFDDGINTSALVSGMYGTLELMLKVYEDQLVVDRHAIVLHHNDGTLKSGVFRLEKPHEQKSKVVFVPIVTGVEELETLQVVDGLKVGDVIVTIGQSHLNNEETVVVLELDGVKRSISASIFQ